MKHLSLFTGAGGGELAAQHLLGWETVGYVEYNEYCQKVIKQRIKDGFLHDAPIFSDIRAFISEGYAEAYQGMVDVISGGFPCQDISCAGKGAGISGEKSGLWVEFYSAIRIIRPSIVFVENSAAITSRGFGRVLGDLAGAGLDAAWCVLGANDIGAFHRRKRMWVVAFAPSERLEGWDKETEGIYRAPTNRSVPSLDLCRPWSEVPDPRAFGSRDGVAHRMDRLKAIGNGQVPAVAATAFRLLAGKHQNIGGTRHGS